MNAHEDDIMGAVGSAIVKAATGQLTKEAVKVIAEATKDKTYRDHLRGLFARKRIMLVGPSGSGKTSLKNVICGEAQRPTNSTEQIETLRTMLSRCDLKLHVKVSDTPGGAGQAVGTILDEIKQKPPEVLVWVPSGGYLKSAGDGPLSRRSCFAVDAKPREFNDSEARREACLKEELKFFSELTHTIGMQESSGVFLKGGRVGSLVVARNKADLWRYDAEQKHVWTPLDAQAVQACKVLCGTHVKPVYFETAPAPGAFEDEATPSVLTPKTCEELTEVLLEHLFQCLV